MRKVTAGLVAAAATLVCAASAMAGGGGTGAYEWKVSFSNTSPDSQVAAAPGSPTPMTLYLWYQGCNGATAEPGMSAAELGAFFTSWSVFGFTPLNGYLNAGDANNLLLAVGSCPVGPVVAGSWTAFGTSGKIRLGKSTSIGFWLATVDCESPVPGNWEWPGQVRAVGAGTTDLAAGLEDWGRGCTGDPVEPTTWGSVKALYR